MDVTDELRVGDAERERVVALLLAHAGAGRLTAEEAGDRIAAAHEAQTDAALRPLLADLPDSVTDPNSSDQNVSGEAERVAPSVLGWRLHAMLCVTFSTGLSGVWLLTRDPAPGPTDAGVGYWWPAWVALVWGMVVVLHALYDHGRLGQLRQLRRVERPGPPPQAGASHEPSTVVADVPDTDPVELPSSLTPREREVLALVGAAYSNQEIARTLHISERTARTHVSNILRKLDLSSRTEAALLAVRAGLAHHTRRSATNDRTTSPAAPPDHR